MTFTAHYFYDFDHYRRLLAARAERLGRRRWHRYAVVLGLYLVAMLVSVWWSGALAQIGGWSSEHWLEIAKIVLGFGAALALFIALVDLVFDRLVQHWVFSRYSQAGKAVSVTLGADGISWTGDAVTGAIGWPAVKGLTLLRDGTAAVLWLGKIEGIVLPAEGFASLDEFRAACAYLKETIRVVP